MNNNYKECPNYEQLECFDCKNCRAPDCKNRKEPQKVIRQLIDVPWFENNNGSKGPLHWMQYTVTSCI